MPLLRKLINECVQWIEASARLASVDCCLTKVGSIQGPVKFTIPQVAD